MTPAAPHWIAVWFSGCVGGRWTIRLENGRLAVQRPDGSRCATVFVFSENTASDVVRWLRTLAQPRAAVEV